MEGKKQEAAEADNEAQPKNLRSLLAPAPEEKLIITPASPLVNSVKNDSPELLDQSVSKSTIKMKIIPRIRFDYKLHAFEIHYKK